MAVGTYGAVKLADVDFNDVDVLYAYSPNRESLGDTQFQPMYNSVTNNEFRKMLGGDGGYKLRLPASIFNRLGFYMILIRPKVFQTQIVDCSFVVTNNDQEIQISKKGIVIPKLQFQSTGSLIGYQIEYFDDNGNKIKNFHRIITSSDLVSVNPNNNTTNASSTTYVINSNGNQIFITLTPDEASLITNEITTDLGKAGQQILLSNTFFDPVMIEVEMVDHSIKTLSYALYGQSTRDLETGVYSIFDENGNLYKQYTLLTNKKQFSNGEIDVKQERTNIDRTQTFFNISQGTI
ncbi:MAG: hypothetical protein AABY15_04215 [Nanoarchaeota archaeon]|mgnify:CR=1 FL=1